MITFRHSNAIRSDVVRAWEKYGQKRFTRLVTEAGLGDHEWEVTLFGSSAASGRPGRPVTVKKLDQRTHTIEVEVNPGQGGYKLAARMNYSGVVGWADVCQHIEAAANRLAAEGKVADRLEGRAATAEKVVDVRQLVKIRDGLTAIIEFGDRLRAAGERVQALEAERGERAALVGEAAEIVADAEADLAAAWENAEAAASAAEEALDRLRAAVREAEDLLAKSEEDLRSTDEMIVGARAAADANQSTLVKDPVVAAIIAAIPRA